MRGMSEDVESVEFRGTWGWGGSWEGTSDPKGAGPAPKKGDAAAGMRAAAKAPCACAQRARAGCIIVAMRCCAICCCSAAKCTAVDSGGGPRGKGRAGA